MASINSAFWIVLLALCALAGCTASGDATEEDYLSDTDTNGYYAGRKSSPGFNVQADTLTAAQRRRGKKGSSNINVRSAAAKKFYSVQIGAYKLKSNADRNYKLCLKRFNQPILRFYEPGIKMERLCVGKFPTAKAAKEYALSIQEQYPKEYQNIWVTVLRHE